MSQRGSAGSARARLRAFLGPALATLLAAMLGACADAGLGEDTFIVVWHPEDASGTEALAGLVREYEDLRPEVRVSRYAIPVAELKERFVASGEQGLGPDLLIAPGDWLPELAERGLLRNLSGTELDPSRYLSLALAPLYLDGDLHGLPLALHPQGLFYNRSLVREPADDLESLLADASRDRLLALPSTFDDSFWGNQAFGGRLQDEQGRIALDEGGYAGWLDWLESAQEVPGVVLDRDRDSLRALFLDGRAAYYVAGPEERSRLREALGEDLGVAALPRGPYGNAGPFIPVTGMFVATASSPEQVSAALDLATYLSGEHGSRVLLRGTDLIPANANVQVHADADPEAFAFASQARFGVPRSTLRQVTEARRVGDEMIPRVLANQVEPSEAARQITDRANEAAGLPPRRDELETCGPAGVLTLWHAWSDAAEAALVAEAERFMLRCPEVELQLSRREEVAITAALRTAGAEPDLVLLSSWRLEDLHEAGLLRDLPVEQNLGFWQRFAPTTTQTVGRDELLYGAPIALHLHALAAAHASFPDAPATRAELLATADGDRPVALARDFWGSYWGVGTEGGLALESDGRLSDEQPALEAWLAALRNAQASEIAVLSERPAEEEAAIARVVSVDEVDHLREEIEAGRLRIVRLPGSASGPATPLLLSDALALVSEADEGTADRALAWIGHISATDAQRRLATAGGRLPATADVSLAGLPALRGFAEQARSAVAIPPALDDAVFLTQGEAMVASVLDEEADIGIAVCRFRAAVNVASGFGDEGSCGDG